VSDPEDFQLTAAAVAGHTPAQAGRVCGSVPELYDSGVSQHMSPLHNCFITYQEILPRPMTAVDKRVFYAIGVRDIIIDVPNGESSTLIRLKDILHAPDMCYVLNTLFPILTNLALHLHCLITHAFHLHHPRMILLHVSPLCFRSDTSFTCISPRQEAVPLHVFKDPYVRL